MGNAIEFAVGFDLGPMVSGAGKMQSIAGKAMGSISAGGAAAFGFFAAAGAKAFGMVVDAAGSMAAGVSESLDLGGALTDLSAQTGISAGKLYILREAFDEAGVGADSVQPAISRMQKMIAGGSKAFEQLGMSVDDLQGLSPDQQFQKIGDAIAGIQDPAQRTKAAMDVFGKSGGKLLSLFGDSGGMSAITAQLADSAELLDRSAGNFDSVGDRLGRSIKASKGGFFLGFTEAVAPAINGILTRIEGMGGFVKYGQQFGGYIAEAGEWLAKGVEYSRAIGDFIVAGFQGAAGAATDMIAGLLELPFTLAEKLATSLEWAFGQAIHALTDLLPDSVKDAMGFGGGGAESFASISGRNQKAQRDFIPGFAAFTDAMHASAQESYAKAADAIAKGQDRMSKVMAATLARPFAAAGFVDNDPEDVADHDLGKKLWRGSNATSMALTGFDMGANKMRDLAFGETKTAGGLIRASVGGLGNVGGLGGAGGQAYGLVRHGSARAQKEEIEARKKAEAEKNKTVEKSNEHLANIYQVNYDTMEVLKEGLLGE